MLDKKSMIILVETDNFNLFLFVDLIDLFNTPFNTNSFTRLLATFLIESFLAFIKDVISEINAC